MATQCRERKKPKNKIVRLYVFLAILVLAGGTAGFFIGKLTAPEKTVTLSEKVEVPVYESDMLVEDADVFLYDIPLWSETFSFRCPKNDSRAFVVFGILGLSR